MATFLYTKEGERVLVEAGRVQGMLKAGCTTSLKEEKHSCESAPKKATKK